MKYILLCPLFLIVIISSLHAQVDRVMTYNIRYDNLNDGINRWDNRKEEVAIMIKHYSPDIFGIQEGKLHQLQYLDSALPNYSRVGVGRDDGKEKGEFSCIYYRNDKFAVLESSTFWLSTTPEKVSVGWDASMERICTYAKFANNSTSANFLVFNTHYDHIGQEARMQSSKLILQKISEINEYGLPVFITGDFNAEPDNEAITTILEEFEDGAALSEYGMYGPVGTFTGFEKGAIPQRRIDYIFIKGITSINRYVHIDDKMKNTNFLSDHLPVMIDLRP